MKYKLGTECVHKTSKIPYRITKWESPGFYYVSDLKGNFYVTRFIESEIEEWFNVKCKCVQL